MVVDQQTVHADHGDQRWYEGGLVWVVVKAMQRSGLTSMTRVSTGRIVEEVSLSFELEVGSTYAVSMEVALVFC